MRTESVIISVCFICVHYLTVIVKCDYSKEDTHVETGHSAVRLQLRYDDQTKRYFLDVYNPEGLADSNMNLTGGQEVTNPLCKLEEGPFRKGPKKDILEFLKYMSWSSAGSNSSDFEYSLNKAVYKVIVEGDGYLRCSAKVSDSQEEVSSERFLKRYLNHIFSMKLRHECSPTQCNSILYWITQGSILTTSLNGSISTFILTVNNIRAYPIKLKLINGTSVYVTYRVEVTMNDQFPADPRQIPSTEDVLLRLHNVEPRKRISSRDKDLELLRLIERIVSEMKRNSTHFSEAVHIRSTRFCHRMTREVIVNGLTSVITWPTTPIGMKSPSLELCVTSNNVPTVLECVGDFSVGAFWASLGTVIECQSTTNRTNRLHRLSSETSITSKMTTMVLDALMTEMSTQLIEGGVEPILSPAEIKYVANTLANIEPRYLLSTELPLIANITTSLMLIPDLEGESKINIVDSLKLAQETSNSSNTILESMDRILNGVQLTNGTEFIVTRKFVTLILDLSNSEGIIGIAALKNPDPMHNYFRKQDIVLLTSSYGIDNLLAMDIAIAVLVPLQLFKYNSRESHRLVVNLFYNDALFGSSQTLGRTKHVLSVTVDGKKHRDLNPPLVLVFDAEHRSNTTANLSGLNSPCVFWDFGSNAGEGAWSDSGCTLAHSVKSSQITSRKDVCICTHLTHFGELLRESPLSYEERGFHKITLDLITLCGCLLSLCGLLGIAVTSIVFPEWRRGTSRKVQLSLCAALGLLMLSFLSLSFTRDTPKDSNFFSSYSCMATGIALHYSIIASFCWMVVAAWGQYFRLTRPFASLNRRPHFLLKASVFAWGVPAIPCLTILLLNSQVYNPPNCYPNGKYLYFAVLLPVVLAVSANATIFILILCSIYNCCGLGMQLVHLRNNQNERTIALRKLLTVLFLFLLLGLSWVFGILNMSYVFCATASLQGLAVFIFFVILEKNTREKWCNLFSQKKSDKMALNSNSFSADFVRRWSHGHQRVHRSTTTRITTISD